MFFVFFYVNIERFNDKLCIYITYSNLYVTLCIHNLCLTTVQLIRIAWQHIADDDVLPSSKQQWFHYVLRKLIKDAWSSIGSSTFSSSYLPNCRCLPIMISPTSFSAVDLFFSWLYITHWRTVGMCSHLILGESSISWMIRIRLPPNLEENGRFLSLFVYQFPYTMPIQYYTVAVSLSGVCQIPQYALEISSM